MAVPVTGLMSSKSRILCGKAYMNSNFKVVSELMYPGLSYKYLAYFIGVLKTTQEVAFKLL